MFIVALGGYYHVRDDGGISGDVMWLWECFIDLFVMTDENSSNEL
jgi:hypothetical protein